MDKAKAAGAGIIRVDVGWSCIEQEAKGQWNQWYLKRLDTVVDKAEARGLKLLLTFWETPCWASSAPATAQAGLRRQLVGAQGPALRARRPGRLRRRALSYVVARYGGRVAAWEIWNEPNHPVYFKADDAAGSYAALVKAGLPGREGRRPERDDRRRVARRGRLRRSPQKLLRPRHQGLLRRLVGPPLQRRPLAARPGTRPLDPATPSSAACPKVRDACCATARTSRCG